MLAKNRTEPEENTKSHQPASINEELFFFWLIFSRTFAIKLETRRVQSAGVLRSVSYGLLNGANKLVFNANLLLLLQKKIIIKNRTRQSRRRPIVNPKRIRFFSTHLRSWPLSSDETSSMCTWSHSCRIPKKKQTKKTKFPRQVPTKMDLTRGKSRLHISNVECRIMYRDKRYLLMPARRFVNEGKTKETRMNMAADSH